MTINTLKRFSIAEYHRLAELGFFAGNDRFELIKGEIVQMVAKGTAHSVCNTRLVQELVMLLGNRAIARVQEPVIIPNNSEPEPDFVIARNRDDDYLSSHPSPVDVLLLIEIADSTLSYDQGVKLSLYAEAGISDYWIFNLVANHLECNSQPYRDKRGNFGYRQRVIFLPNESVILPCFPDLSLDLSKVFPIVNN